MRPRDASAHLVERTVEALGDLGRIGVLPLRRPAEQDHRRPAEVAPLVLRDPRPLRHAAETKRPDPARPAPAPGGTTVALDALRRAGLVVRPDGVRSRVSEEMAAIHHQVLQATKGGEHAAGRIVLVTSARPGEGKTFTALNLAAGLAIGGTHRVVLVDADGKNESVSGLLGLDHAEGLRALAEDDARSVTAALAATAITGLSIMPHGAAPGEGQGRLPGGVVAALIQRLAEALPDHVIVIDAPPCLSTSDPRALAPLAGQVLMVVEAQKTPRNELEAALDTVDACPLIQLVLNKVRLATRDSFGAYAHEHHSG